jgi:hypothetical protein
LRDDQHLVLMYLALHLGLLGTHPFFFFGIQHIAVLGYASLMTELLSDSLVALLRGHTSPCKVNEEVQQVPITYLSLSL